MGTLVAWLALLVGVAGLLYGWKLSQEMAVARRRLDRYNRALFDAAEQIRTLQESLAQTQAQLGAVSARQEGRWQVAPEMTVRQAQALHPQIQEALAAFHLGGCSSCAVEPDATLAQLCAANGQDLPSLLTTLNHVLQAGYPGQPGEEPKARPVRLPNVELSL